MKRVITYMLAVAALLVFAQGKLSAAKASPKIQKIVQPNGTCIPVRIVGDHIFGYKETLYGEMVETGPDGYLHYVTLTSNGKELSPERVTATRKKGNYSIPQYLVELIRKENSLHCKRPGKKFAIPQNTKSNGETIMFPVLLVQFEDVKFCTENPQKSFDALLNSLNYTANGATGSAAEYLNANFRGRCTFGFDVSDTITLPFPISAYGAPSGTFNDTNIPMLVQHACNTAAEQGYDFSKFATNGTVKNVSIIFAGHSEAEGGRAESIWPHQQDISSNNIFAGGIKIDSYTCTAELGGAQGTQMATIGTFCHEFSHFLGLPDLYDINGTVEGLSPALYGTLSIMDEGNYLNGGKTPPYYNAIEREILGLGTIKEIVPDSSYTIHPNYREENIYMIPASANGEYFLLECRNTHKWDKFIGGYGMVVYHIDKSENSYGGIESQQRWIYNNINCYAEHECAKVVAACTNTGNIQEIFFPGPANVTQLLSQGENVQFKEWNGHAVGIGLKEIRYSNGKVSFATVRDFSFNSSLPCATGCIIKPFQTDAKIEWDNGNGSESQTQWMVSWTNENEDENVHEHSIITDTTCCCINGLVPANGYKVQIRSLRDKEYGNPVSMTFRTVPITSSFPYIHIAEPFYRVGTTLDLRIFNLQEKHSTVAWSINGQPHSSSSVTFLQEGEMEIVATIKYNDGSDEKIYKTILVK